MFIVGLYEFELTSCVWLCAEIDVSQCFSSRLCWTICWYVWNWFCDLKMPDEDCSADFFVCKVICWVLCRLRMLFLSFLSLLIQTAAWKWNSNVHELICVRIFNVGLVDFCFGCCCLFCIAHDSVRLCYDEIDIKFSRMQSDGFLDCYWFSLSSLFIWSFWYD